MSSWSLRQKMYALWSLRHAWERAPSRMHGRTDCTLATVDHNVPTSDRASFDTVENFIKEADSRTQVMALEENVREFGVTYFGMDDTRQGIVHVIGPEQGFTLPGAICVCGKFSTQKDAEEWWW